MGQAVDQAGNVWETDATGKAVRFLRKATPSGPPRDPTFDYKAPQAAATLGKTREEIEAIRQQNVIAARKQSLAEREFATTQRLRQAQLVKARKAKKTQIMSLMNDIVAARKMRSDVRDEMIPGTEVGGVSGFLKMIPGTAAQDLDNQIGALKGSVARSSISSMRQESPTGGAVGDTNAKDIVMLETARGPLSQSSNRTDFSRDLDTVERRTWEELQKVSPAAARILRERLDGKKAKPAAPRGAPSRGEFLGFED